MPQDLIRYENANKIESETKFKENGVHLMPLSRHAFYMKEDILFSEPGSYRDANDGQHDFYRGARTSEKIKIKLSN